MPTSEQADVQPPANPPDERSATRGPARAGYLAFVAHEMRNPLSTALWTAELLTRLSPEDRAGPRGEKLATMCLRTLARLRNLVEDHFLAERLAINGLPVRMEQVRVEEAVATAAGKLSGVQVEADVAGALVTADRGMLERSLEALIAAASRDGAQVRVRAGQEGDTTVIRVDGAPPLADALRSPDRSTPSDPTGRALAMLMTQAIARAHGGELRPTESGWSLALPVTPAGEVR